MLQGKKIILGITGSIAAYKSVTLLRLLVKAGAEVKVIMTPEAKDFVAPLTFSTLSKSKVLDDLFKEQTWENHALLGRWADLMIIAPASCNTLAKMAGGICDNLLLAVYLSATCPVLIAPAMDEDMWHHPATRRNVSLLHQYGHRFLPVGNGQLASGLSGDGRMSEPEEIAAYLTDFLTTSLSLAGLKALVTAGPTQEALDPVRYIGNRSSGKMGVAIAGALLQRGAAVNLILGPSSVEVSNQVVTTRVTSAGEMYEACMQQIQEADIIIMAAAVADFTPRAPKDQKIKKAEGELVVELVRTRDILLQAGELKKAHQTLVGFALETQNEKESALQKLHSKKANLIVLNSLNDPGAGFGYDTNKITIFDNLGHEYHFPAKSKTALAADIVNTIIQYRNV